MHKLLLLLSLLTLAIGSLYSQNYNIDQYDNQTISSCSGNFYDSGGPTGDYNADESYVVTFSPTSNFANITFNTFGASIGDVLEVFDGADVNASLIAIFNNGNTAAGQTVRASFLGAQGKLTVRWTSVGTNTGWSATISCGMPCQSFNTIIAQSTPAYTIENGIYYIDVCPGDSVKLRASADFYLNNVFYNQDTTTTDFTWTFGLNNYVDGQDVTTVMNNIQGYNAYIVATDTLGCPATQTTEVRIRVSTPPVFAGTTLDPYEICQNDTTTLMGNITPTPWYITPSLSVAGVTYLPDVAGATYTSILNFSGFATGQVLQNPSDIVKIFMEMEHTWLGDLNIVIQCPNGSAVTLKSYPGGGGAFLGEPIDNELQIPGLGYMYHWSTNGTTTMTAASSTYQYTFTDVAGNTYANKNYLPPSTAYPAGSTATGTLPIVQYEPETPMSNLLGCPLNGDWKIITVDNLTVDNGFVFQWGIEFSPALLPVSWGYTPVIDTSHWNVGIPGDTTLYSTNLSGNQTLTYSMTDVAGCTYDTTINVLINPSPSIELGNDTNICLLDSIMLYSNNTLANSTYLWSNNDTLDSVVVFPLGTQEFSLIATSPLGCQAYDTIKVTLAPLPTIQISDDTLICIGSAASLSASGGVLYQWSNGETSDNNIVTPVTTSIYQLTVTDANACVNDTSVTVNVTTNLDITISNDTVICEGTTANIKASGGDIYNWSNGVSTANQIVSPTSSTTYTVIIADTNSCKDSADIIVQILENPVAQIYANYDTICRNGTIELQAAGGMYYKWRHGKTETNIEEIAKLSERYFLTATNLQEETKCFDTTSVYVVVENCAVYIPNAFTPNGDGLNDIFKAEGVVSQTASFSMLIYNRQGQLIFESNDINIGWDGTFNSNKIPNDTYTWLIRVTEKSIDSYELVGTVHLLR